MAGEGRRVTVTLDDGSYGALRAMAWSEGVPLSQVVRDALRAALPPAADSSRTDPVPHGGKTSVIKCYVTPSQKEEFHRRAAAAGRSLSSYVALCCLHDGPVTLCSYDDEAFRSAALELVRQGTNLNQLAHRINSVEPWYLTKSLEAAEGEMRSAAKTASSAAHALMAAAMTHEPLKGPLP